MTDFWLFWLRILFSWILESYGDKSISDKPQVLFLPLLLSLLQQTNSSLKIDVRLMVIQGLQAFNIQIIDVLWGSGLVSRRFVFVIVFAFVCGYVFVFVLAFLCRFCICICACCCSYMWHMHLSDQVVLFSQGFSVRTQVAQSQFTNIAHIWTWSDGWMGDINYVQIQLRVGEKLLMSTSCFMSPSNIQDYLSPLCRN